MYVFSDVNISAYNQMLITTIGFRSKTKLHRNGGVMSNIRVFPELCGGVASSFVHRSSTYNFFEVQ